MPMLDAQMKYSAVAAKVRALYGRMLTDRDWARLREMKTVVELAAFLRGHPGWKDAVSPLPEGTLAPRDLEAALRRQLAAEYERLFKFAAGEDKKFMLVTLYRAEFTLILATLRKLGSVNPLPSEDILPGFYLRKSDSDLEGIKNAQNFQQLLSAAEGGIYAETLRRLPKNPATGLPDYQAAATALENRCFSAVYGFLTRGFSGEKREALIAFIGEKADLLNVTHLLRLRRFPDSLPDAERLLIPIRYRLKSATIAALKSARTDAAALEALQNTPWRKYFKELGPYAIERQYREYMSSFYRKLVNAPMPTACIPQAYLSLKEFECDKLIHLTEALRLGVDPAGVV